MTEYDIIFNINSFCERCEKMEAFNRMIYDDVIKKTDVQYTIPVYQRNYTWEKEHCDKLFDDILNSIKLNKNHFLGSLVYSVSKRNDIKSCPIIDGQQRLTTIMLLLKAIDDSIEDSSNITKMKIRKNLYNELCEERYKLKLKNTDEDNGELEKILMGGNAILDNDSKIVINYMHFKTRVKNAIEKYNINYDDLLSGISKLEIVEIVLSETDSPQKIFESINSTGVKLTTADLIRNFLLMGITDAGKQSEIYKRYWVTMENLIGKENVEKFFYNFLVSKDSKYIEESKVYHNFKEYYLNRDVSDLSGIESIFEELLKYVKYYKLIVCNDSKNYGDLSNGLCKTFNVLQHRTIYPFLLKICDDFEIVLKKYEKNQLLDEKELEIINNKEIEFNKILELLGNYALRRNISDIASSSLRRFYATLYSRIFDKNKENYNFYYKAIESYLCTIKTEDKMPNDNMFIEGLKYGNMYASTKSKILRMFFDLIENHGKEKVDMSDLTIEHIMPETLSSIWKSELGDNYQEVYDKYVHTLGNLSITGYNSEYSNDPYKEKKKLFNELKNKGESKIIKLNEELISDKILFWGEDEIVNRAKRLIEIILKQFPYPIDVDYSLEFEKFYEFYIDNPNDDGDEFASSNIYRLYGFEFENTKYKAESYKGIYKEIIRILYRIDNNILDDMANSNLTYERGTRILFSKNIDNNGHEEVLPNLFVYTNYNRSSIFEWIRELFKRYQLDIETFNILFIDKE